MENNLPFVGKLARSIWAKNPDWSRALGIEEEDFCQEGCLAKIRSLAAHLVAFSGSCLQMIRLYYMK